MAETRLVSTPVDSPLQGALVMPGDKSISHRSLMFAAIADGTSELAGVLEGEDCLATADAMRAMGVPVSATAHGRYTVTGRGLRGLAVPASAIDLGNSGTGMRLMCGLLAAQSFGSTLIGDASLSRRPMRRVTDPLVQMGADILTEDGHAPIRIKPVPALSGIDYQLPVASAQLKSALLIAGLFATSAVTVREPAVSRDHTERMLASMGADVTSQKGVVSIQPAQRLSAFQLSVPSDLSSAAFFLVAASIVPGSALSLPAVGVNPTRDGVLRILQAMGADIRRDNERDCSGEPVADIHVSATQLRGTSVDPSLVPLAIDEFPVLFVAAAVATGQSHFAGLAELRHKESDRIDAMVRGLRALGVSVTEGEDWVTIDGGTISAGTVDSFTDHRIAMAFAVAGSVAQGPVHVRRPENIATSFPDFVELAAAAGMHLGFTEVS
ncbi:MAG: 3-phosphoshikimate 1-carboxyvinyltransferase [Pseudomonadota bacterium]